MSSIRYLVANLKHLLCNLVIMVNNNAGPYSGPAIGMSTIQTP